MGPFNFCPIPLKHPQRRTHCITYGLSLAVQCCRRNLCEEWIEPLLHNKTSIEPPVTSLVAGQLHVFIIISTPPDTPVRNFLGVVTRTLAKLVLGRTCGVSPAGKSLASVRPFGTRTTERLLKLLLLLLLLGQRQLRNKFDSVYFFQPATSWQLLISIFPLACLLFLFLFLTDYVHTNRNGFRAVNYFIAVFNS